MVTSYFDIYNIKPPGANDGGIAYPAGAMPSRQINAHVDVCS